MHTRAWLGLVSSTLLAGALLGACGDDQQEPTGASGPTTTTTTTSTGGGGAGGEVTTGGGGAGGTTTTGGSGGTGGAPECTVAGDCGAADDCHSFTCDAGTCNTVFTALGTKTTDQVAGDCQRNVCDGNGGVAVEDDETDAFDDQNDCTDDVCVAGVPMNDATIMGETCASSGGAFCDGEKACVECLLPGDCESGACGADHKCVPASCGDGVMNGEETGLDCGGSLCGKCVVGMPCMVGTDCISLVCDPVLLTCSAPTCMDGVKNGAESDLDCGGPLCNDCGTGKSCGNPADCVDGVCSGNPLKCQAATCMDGVKNGAESDLDCGGPLCNDCINGKLCSMPNDCVSGVCSGAPQTCQIPSCSDAVKNAAETGVDCGGPACGPCAVGIDCNLNTDCLSGFCNAGKKCATPNCNDGAKNGMETDVDCGGPTCGDCANGLACNDGSDCTSTFCAGSPKVCQNLNGCNPMNTMDLTGQSMTTVTFGGLSYAPQCIKVSAGTMVSFSGDFTFHPLLGGTVVGNMATPAGSGPFMLVTNSGTQKNFSMSTAGAFPYYCTNHFGGGMFGAIFVVP